LIGGATLVSVPLGITSCGKKHVPDAEKFSFSTPLNGATFGQNYGTDPQDHGVVKMGINVLNAPDALVV
jgi:hypothetical protein